MSLGHQWATQESAVTSWGCGYSRAGAVWKGGHAAPDTRRNRLQPLSLARWYSTALARTGKSTTPTPVSFVGPCDRGTREVAAVESLSGSEGTAVANSPDLRSAPSAGKDTPVTGVNE
ncbi:hypothetical protein PAL_GLEAN10002655 [Pteropus alecto]|uniref:Uncharacterized protein n=1 Tax=Pteropus alecto TaxID=9402 RepID=L5KC03_PTEAL|nr:hypothetical protein PAL_GLEAN10002655 [Pteropus alecto]